MLGPPIDAWYTVIALSIASVAIVGVAFSLPAATTPAAESTAETVDAVAASEPPATGAHPISADRVKIGPHRLTLATGDDTTTATYRFGPVTPAHQGSKLSKVAHGAAPKHVFDSPAEFQRATERARERDPDWESARDQIVIRNVSWGDVDVTLVGT